MNKTLSLKLSLFLFTLTLGANVLYASSFKLISDVGASAKTIGLGNIEGLGNDASVIFENPASLANTPDWSASFFTTTFFDESVFHAVSLSKSLGQMQFGVGYMSLGIVDVPKTVINQATNQFEVASNFDYKNTMFKLGAAVPGAFFNKSSFLEHTHIGLNAIFYNHSIDTYEGQASDIELGATYNQAGQNLSLSLRNLLTSEVDYGDNNTENLPFQFILSGNKAFDTFTLYGQYKHTLSQHLPSLAVKYPFPFAPNLYMTAGYKTILVVNDTEGNLTLGLGLALNGVRFNYAYESSDHVLYNSKHYFSISVAAE